MDADISTLRTDTENTSLLSFINQHPNDKNITFVEDGHIYFIHGKSTGIVSCTSFIHSFFSKFDSKKIILQICKSDRWKNDPMYQYYQKSPSQIENEWEINRVSASSQGTKLHAMIEHFFNDRDIEYDDSMLDFTQFLKFNDDHPDLCIFRTEWIIYSEELMIAGSIDAVFVNADGTYTIFDWKRSKEIHYEAYGDKLCLAPFNHLPDCNYTHYCLQLNLYKTILEKHYAIKIRDMYLCVFHPNNPENTYIKINVPHMPKESELMIVMRKNFLEKSSQKPFNNFSK
jgi:hypothetical protein